MADVLIRVIGNTGSANRALAQTERRVKGLRTATRASSPAVRGLRTNLSGLSQTAGLAQSSVFQLTGAFILVGGLVLALRATSRASIEFQAEMTKLQTLVGIQPELVRKWAVSLREMAPAVGVGPRELSKALFVVTSAGIRSGEALEIVRLAAQASAIGLGDVTSVARAVTSAMQAYSKTNLSAAEATDVLVATVREGNLVASELASSLGRVLGIAAEVGVGFAELGGFIATFTRVGVSAQESVTALRGILNTTLKPSKQATEALAQFGITIGDVRRAIREEGLARTLIDLVSILREDEDALAAVFGNVRALSGVLATAGAQAEEFDRIIQSVSDSTGILAEGFATVSTTAKQSMAEAKAAVEVLALTIGDKLLPQIADIASGWAAILNPTQLALQGTKKFLVASRDQNQLAFKINTLSKRRLEIEKDLARFPVLFTEDARSGKVLRLELERINAAVAFGIELLRQRAVAIAAAAEIAPDRPNIFIKPPLLSAAQAAEVATLAQRINQELAANLEVQLAITPRIEFKPPVIDVSLGELVFSNFEEMMRQATSAVAAAATPAERLAEMMRSLRIAEAASVITTDELRKAQVFLEAQYASSTRTFTELAITIGPAIAATLAQVIAAVRGQGGGLFGALSGLLGAGAAVAGLIPGGQLVGAGLLAGSLVSGAFRSQPQRMIVDSFGETALEQQRQLEPGPRTVILQVITNTGALIDEVVYQIGRRDRRDQEQRLPIGDLVFRGG